jgi:hypothetical protein
MDDAVVMLAKTLGPVLAVCVVCWIVGECRRDMNE